jgi:hypothetical protein
MFKAPTIALFIKGTWADPRGQPSARRPALVVVAGTRPETAVLEKNGVIPT